MAGAPLPQLAEFLAANAADETRPLSQREQVLLRVMLAQLGKKKMMENQVVRSQIMAGEVTEETD